MSLQRLSFAEQHQFVGILELICQKLEISESQYNEAKNRYEAIGKWLANSSDYRLIWSTIYPQGSMRIGTSVKPIGRDEFDVDLMCHLKLVNNSATPKEINKLVGDRLRENRTYENMLEQLKRGWRIKYANQFHLDITPSIKNLQCKNGGELVPDRKLQEWKPSNPIGYADWFEAHAALMPSIIAEFAARAEVLPFPSQGKFKGVLKRSVQIFKRHRDLYFQNKNNELKPISIIITTLAAKSYKFCVENREYQGELELLMDTLTHMVEFINVHEINGSKIFIIPNETTVGENFAEKWNENPQLSQAFYEWHNNALNSLDSLWSLSGRGIDVIAAKMSESFGQDVVRRSINEYTESINEARSKDTLKVLPSIGLVTRRGTRVKHNTFYGL